MSINNSIELPTKEEVYAQHNNNSKNINRQIPHFNNDDSKINIINNNKRSLLDPRLNHGPAPVFIPNQNIIPNPINQKDINVQINSNQINPNQINSNQINPNQINPNQINPNQINPNQNYQQNIYNNYQNPKMMPEYIPPVNQINIIQPVIVQSSYDQHNNINVRQEREEKKVFWCIIAHYLSIFFNRFLFYFCCLLIRYLRNFN